MHLKYFVELNKGNALGKIYINGEMMTFEWAEPKIEVVLYYLSYVKMFVFNPKYIISMLLCTKRQTKVAQYVLKEEMHM